MGRRSVIVAALGALAILIFIIVVLFYEPIEEGHCRLKRKKIGTFDGWLELAVQLLLPLDTRPESLKDLPMDFNQPQYYEIKSNNKRIPVVVNLSERPTMCLDTNGDGILSLEKYYAALQPNKKNDNICKFGPIEPLYMNGSGDLKNGFYVNFNQVTLSTFPVSYRRGKLRVDGQVYRVAVVDGDCDGLFNSILSLPLDRDWRIASSDVFAIDLNRNGRFDFSLTASSEVMPLGKLVQIDGAYYAIDIASDGANLTLSRTEPQFGTLLVDADNALVELKLWSDGADQWLSPGHEWQLPVGNYKAVRAKLSKKDASGNVWVSESTLSSAYTHLGPLEFFTIRHGETTTIRIGPPFIVKTDINKTSPREVSIGLTFVGCSGEEYKEVFQEYSPKRSSPPSFTIVDEKGTVLVADKFRYG